MRVTSQARCLVWERELEDANPFTSPSNTNKPMRPESDPGVTGEALRGNVR